MSEKLKRVAVAVAAIAALAAGGAAIAGAAGGADDESGDGAEAAEAVSGGAPDEAAPAARDGVCGGEVLQVEHRADGDGGVAVNLTPDMKVISSGSDD